MALNNTKKVLAFGIFILIGVAVAGVLFAFNANRQGQTEPEEAVVNILQNSDAPQSALQGNYTRFLPPDSVIEITCKPYANISGITGCRQFYEHIAKNYNATITSFGLMIEKADKKVEPVSGNLNQLTLQPNSRLLWYASTESRPAFVLIGGEAGTQPEVERKLIMLDAKDLSVVKVMP